MTDDKNNKMGRPTKYSEVMLDKARMYLEIYSTELGHAVPSIAGLSTYIKIRRSTIYEWAKDEEKEEFSDILEEILSEQEQKALSNGLNNIFNATIVKLILGKHGYTDKVDKDVNYTGAINIVPIDDDDKDL